MSRAIAISVLCVSVAAAGCSGTFGSVSRSTRISDGSRVSASSILPSEKTPRAVTEQLALAEEIYAKQLEALTDRRDTLRSRRRTLNLASYATFAATTLVIGAAAISRGGGDAMTTPDGDLRLAGYGALGGLGLGTTLEVVNLMQEDSANVEAKRHALTSAHDTMVQRLNDMVESANQAGIELTPEDVSLKAGAIIGEFIDEALQINIKG